MLTVHLGYCNDKLVHSAVHHDTVRRVTEGLIDMLRDPVVSQRAYPIGESDWPVEIVLLDRVILDDGSVGEWRHVIRRADDQWRAPAKGGDNAEQATS